jgi:hypothetical protein
LAAGRVYNGGDSPGVLYMAVRPSLRAMIAGIVCCK